MEGGAMGGRCFRIMGWGLFFLLITCCFTTSALAVEEVHLIDNSDLEWTFDTNHTNTTATSEASGAAYEASYTHSVTASTSAGGTTNSTLTDAFDGYSAVCISTTGATGPCAFSDANYIMYNNNGVGAFDPASGNRQFVLNAQAMGNLTMVRKFYVPNDDSFARWLNIITNTGLTTITFNLIISGELGSDANTIIFATSSGDLSADVNDNWVATMEDYSGGTSADPRLGHILKTPHAAVGLAAIHFADGDASPWWAYTITLTPGPDQNHHELCHRPVPKKPGGQQGQ